MQKYALANSSHNRLYEFIQKQQCRMTPFKIPISHSHLARDTTTIQTLVFFFFSPMALTMKVLPQAFPSRMGKLNLTTGGTTDESSVPLQSVLSQIRLRISRLALYPV